MLTSQSHGNPFISLAFLQALEDSGAVGEGTGWLPEHLLVERYIGPAVADLSNADAASWDLVAVIPQYRKFHSYGEYVFDWAWADAYQRHKQRYYPKLLSAVPFSPIPGARLIARDAQAHQVAAQAVHQYAEASRLSSAHVLFGPEQDMQALAGLGWMIRHGVQFHWHNRGYRSYDDFLDQLDQKKRKKIKAEQRKVREAGVSTTVLRGAQITEQHWRFFDACYAQTYVEHHATPYLNQQFFELLAQRLGDQVILVLASRGEQWLGASLLITDGHTLWGRYWGCIERVPCMHFECAYYTPLRWAIEHGIQRFEGGAQGEHKLARGFDPVPTYSAHWLRHPAFRDAVDRFLARETAGMQGYLSELNEHRAYRTLMQPGDQADQP